MEIGIIGAGEMGSLLASKFVKLGHVISIANSRGPASLKQLTENIGADATTVENVTKNKQVIIVAIPQKSIPNLPKSIFKDLPKDVVVIDTGNYYPNLRDGILPQLSQSGIDSLWVQEQLGVSIVKVFNSILATSIESKSRTKDQMDRVAIAVSGDDVNAKEIVFQMVDQLGFDYFDLGDIHRSWQKQPGSPIYCRDIGLSTLKERISKIGTNWPEMKNVILSKREANEALMREDYQAYLKGLQ